MRIINDEIEKFMLKFLVIELLIGKFLYMIKKKN